MMRKLLLLSMLFLISVSAYCQEKKGIWFELDGVYWEKALKQTQSIAPEKARFGGGRFFAGIPLGKSWSLGLMGSHHSYYEPQETGYTNRSIYGPPAEDGNSYSIVGIARDPVLVGLQNELVGFGLFLQKSITLGERTSVNFNLFSMRERGANAKLEFYPDYSYLFWWPCLNCLSIVPGPFLIPVEETNWRTGLDVSFSYALNNWVDVGLRANFLEFRKQIIQKEPMISNHMGQPNQFSVLGDIYAGDYFYFGSAVPREGIRISLTFKPF
ncbi:MULTISPECIES: hypothetical protein [unclassified Algoriphagus]|jgi:hypothetical protein|uniref:hypothetical protein n=1 Tax=unclassified Algoriphagus TaxID=2641541 RepID=UPI001C62BFC5|nr:MULTISPECIES: hypothetical protein [unclassified Algoriphagus]QYH40767.1 hypothetical protein GYM62_18910 [Algoriphagus sp. NBT04N3]|tara:strand:- start:1272 stop:2081 length:810 start_codon:yes stop_codon:yes gene_type:complete